MLILENVDANHEMNPVPCLEGFIRRVLDVGISALVESRRQLSFVRIDPRLLQRAQLDALDLDEVKRWAINLGVDFTGDVADALSLLDGHPALLRLVLEALSSGAAGPNDVLQLAVQAQPAVAGPAWAPPPLSPFLATRLGLLPWVPLTAAEISARGLSAELANLVPLGFFHASADGSRRETAWARAAALRDLMQGHARPVELPEDCTRGLDAEQIARSVVHLETLRIRLDGSEVANMATRLQRRLLPQAADRSFAEYVAPRAPDVESVEPSTIGLLARLERDARLSGRVSPGLLVRLVSRPDLMEHVTENWGHAKAAYVTLTRTVLSTREKLQIWGALLDAFRGSSWAVSSDATRAWMARTCAIGARAVRRHHQFEMSDAWLSLGTEMLPQRIPAGSIARSLSADTRYLLSSAPALAPRSASERLQAHLSALDAIPPAEAWMPLVWERWAGRKIWHLYSVRQFDDGHEIDAQIVRQLDQWPPSPSWARAYELFRGSWESWNEGLRVGLHRALDRAIAHTNKSGNPRLLSLLLLLHPDPLAFQVCRERFEQATALADEVDRLAMRIVLDRMPPIPVGMRRGWADTVDGVLQKLTERWCGEVESGNDDSALVIRLVDTLVAHYLNPSNAGNADAALSRVRRVPSLLDSRFERLIEATGIADLYLQWAEARILAVRTRAYLMRRCAEEAGEAMRRDEAIVIERQLSESLVALADRFLRDAHEEPAACLAAASLHSMSGTSARPGN